MVTIVQAKKRGHFLLPTSLKPFYFLYRPSFIECLCLKQVQVVFSELFLISKVSNCFALFLLSDLFCCQIFWHACQETLSKLFLGSLVVLPQFTKALRLGTLNSVARLKQQQNKGSNMFFSLSETFAWFAYSLCLDQATKRQSMSFRDTIISFNFGQDN